MSQEEKSTITAYEYVKQKKEEERKTKEEWLLKSYPLPNEEKKILEKTLKILKSDNEYVKNLSIHKEEMSNYDNYSTVLNALSESLKNDLNIYTNNKYSSLVKKCALGILESGKVHAACVKKTEFDDLLDGYAIFIIY